MVIVIKLQPTYHTVAIIFFIHFNTHILTFFSQSCTLIFILNDAESADQSLDEISNGLSRIVAIFFFLYGIAIGIGNKK